jgi:hypothetical protein
VTRTESVVAMLSEPTRSYEPLSLTTYQLKNVSDVPSYNQDDDREIEITRRELEQMQD